MGENIKWMEELRDNVKEKLPFYKSINLFHIVESTQDECKKLAFGGMEEGGIVLSSCQTKGRGRYGREWFSPAEKGLYLSILLRPSFSPQWWPTITLTAGLSLAETIEEVFGVKPQLKWPNDCLINQKKVAGILAEGEPENGFVILGCGVNLEGSRDDFPEELKDFATSFEQSFNISVNKTLWTFKFLEIFYRNYISFKETKSIDIKKWLKYCQTIGKKVITEKGEGIMKGINPNGALIIEKKDGEIVEIISGEVKFI